MPRGLLAGMTDYSHQTLEDMIEDLNEWIESLTQVNKTLDEGTQKLQEENYWDKVDYDVHAILSYSTKFFDTSIAEIADILEGIRNEVEDNYVTRIKSLARTANILNRDIGRIWHQYPWERNKEYKNPTFRILERMYSETRGMAADMSDLGNLANRLKDFVGRKGRAAEQLPPPAKRAGRVRRVLHAIFVDVPMRLGGLVKKIGLRLDDFASWLIGMAIIIVVVLAVLGLVNPWDVVNLVKRALGIQ